MMDRFDDELRDAMRREPAPDWFVDGVMRKLRAGPEPRRAWLARVFSGSWVRWAALTATLVVVFGGVRLEQTRRERAAGEQAKAQLMLALQVTGSKLHVAQQRVMDFGARE